VPYIRIPRTGGRNGSKHGRRITLPSPLDALDLPQRPLRSIGEVSSSWRKRSTESGKGHSIFVPRNAIGFLAGILLKALDQRLEERLIWKQSMCGKRGTDTEVFEFRSVKEPPHEKPRQKRLQAIELTLTPQQVVGGVAQKCIASRDPSKKGPDTRHRIVERSQMRCMKLCEIAHGTQVFNVGERRVDCGIPPGLRATPHNPVR
jgi:hypothetical protein